MNLELHLQGPFCQDLKASNFVSAQLQTIVNDLGKLPIEILAIILTGSFGRGEGAVSRDTADTFVALNDYDLVIVTERPLHVFERHKLKHCKRLLVPALNLWHLDLMPFSIEQLRETPISLFRYDARFGGQVIYGDTNILSQIPCTPDTTIPKGELRNLLINRMITLLEGCALCARQLSLNHKARQIAKVFYALTDSLLIHANCYKTRYGDKRAAIGLLAETSESARSLLSLIDWSAKAWNYNLSTDEKQIPCIMEKWEQARTLLTAEILKCSIEIDQLPSVSQEFVMKNWRSGVSRNPLKKLLLRCIGKYPRCEIEKKIFLLLTRYSRTQQEHWAKGADTLIRKWYRSVE